MGIHKFIGKAPDVETLGETQTTRGVLIARFWGTSSTVSDDLNGSPAFYPLPNMGITNPH